MVIRLDELGAARYSSDWAVNMDTYLSLLLYLFDIAINSRQSIWEQTAADIKYWLKFSCNYCHVGVCIALCYIFIRVFCLNKIVVVGYTTFTLVSLSLRI